MNQEPPNILPRRLGYTDCNTTGILNSTEKQTSRNQFSGIFIIPNEPASVGEAFTGNL